MTGEAVPPALTADEWTHAKADGYRHDGPAHDEHTAPGVLHYSMAMANALLPHGDPRKITHADVNAARIAAEQLARLAEPGQEGPGSDGLLRVAAKLAALLPPDPLDGS